MTVKLLRSVIMKGLEALATEALPAARAYGVLDQLYAVLGDVDQAPFTDLLKSMVATHPAHAVRRHAEVLEAAAQLESIGCPAGLTEQVAGKFAATADSVARTGGPENASIEASLDWLATSAVRASESAATQDRPCDQRSCGGGIAPPETAPPPCSSDYGCSPDAAGYPRH